MAVHMTVTEAVQGFLLYRKTTCAPTTVRNEAIVLRRFADWYGDVQMRHLRAEKVEAWFTGPNGVRQPHVTRDRVHRKPVSESTANYYRKTLAGFFRWAIQRGHLRSDPLIHVAPLRSTRRARLQLSPDQMMNLLRVPMDGRDRAFIALLINTALRGGSAIALTVGDVDLPSLSLQVRITKSHLEDSMPITADLEEEIERWLRRYALDLRRPLRDCDYLFPARGRTVYAWAAGADGAKVRRRTAHSWAPDRPMSHPERVVKEAMTALGFDTKGEGCHTLRRSVARAFFDARAKDQKYDGALRTTQSLLHHQSAATTEIYLGLSTERVHRDAVLRGQPFLSALVGHSAPVVPLRPAIEGLGVTM